MGESITDIPCLQQSVSFGRFERDSLSWERWSTFPTNKYLEEVEKYSTPGSVAQKKAYFEAHYKKIAARRAELLLDQEREREAELGNSEDVGFTSLIDDTVEGELDYGKMDIENEVGSFDDDVHIEHVYPKSHSTDNLYQENVVASFDGEVTDGNIAGMLNSENEIGSFDGDVSVKHIHIKSDSADMPNLKNVMGSFDDDVSVEHMNSNSADLLYLENEVGSFDGEHFHVKSDSVDGFNHETDASDLPSEMSGHDDETLTVNAVSEVPNIGNEKFEDMVAFTDDGTNVDDAGEVVKMEVAKDIHELKDDADIVDEVVKSEVTGYFDKKPQEEIASSDMCPSLKIAELGKPKEPFSAIEDAPSKQDTKGEELPQEKVKRTIIEEGGRSLMKLATPKKIQKVPLVKKITSTPDAKKKPASPLPKRTTTPMPRSPMLSTPKSSKPEVTKVTKVANPASRQLNKDSSFTPSTNKKTIGSQMKMAVPTSLHMSLSLGPLNSDTSSLTMRKSLIMETMADKDIVKRAFKAFQNAPQISPAANQSASRKAEQKGSPGKIIPKKIAGSSRAVQVASTPTRSGQQGTRKTLVSPGVNNKSSTQRNMKSVAASFGPRVQLQKINQTVVSKEVESQATHLAAKLKVEKNVQLKKPSESINSKPKARSSYNHRQGGTILKKDGMTPSSS